jgi:hypothetical protein
MTRQTHALLGATALIVAALLADPPPARANLAGFCVLCGNNAAKVSDGVVFDELNVDKRRRGDGPAIKEVIQISTKAQARLLVKGDTLFAIVGDKTLAGDDLKDILIVLTLENGREFQLTLVSYNKDMHYWAAPAGSTPAYDFFVNEVSKDGPKSGARERHLCDGQFVDDTGDLQRGDVHTAMVFEGDHYDDKHVVRRQKAGWFNLACFGTAAAKMHLLRYTRAGAEAGHSRPPSFERRTTMLRAITADYCGDGRSWTADGTPLVWTEKEQIFPLGVQPDFAQLQRPGHLQHQVEAAWGPNGRLLCLNEPRRAAPAPAGMTPPSCSIPGIDRTDVVQGPIACKNAQRLPRCDAFQWSGRPANPWSGPPLATATGERATPLSAATVVTVNRKPAGSYCAGISWPR